MAATSSSEDAPARLVAAAMVLFSERGYDGVGIREIADEAGCSLSLIKHHFGSKGGLLEHVITREMAVVQSELAAIATADDDLEGQFERLVASMVDVFERHRAGVQIVLRELMQSDSPFADRLVPAIRDVVDVVVRMLAAARERERLRPVDPQVAAVLLFAMLQYHAATSPGSTDLFGEDPIRSIKETIVTIFLHGVLIGEPHQSEHHERT